MSCHCPELCSIHPVQSKSVLRRVAAQKKAVSQPKTPEERALAWAHRHAEDCTASRDNCMRHSYECKAALAGYLAGWRERGRADVSMAENRIQHWKDREPYLNSEKGSWVAYNSREEAETIAAAIRSVDAGRRSGGKR